MVVKLEVAQKHLIHRTLCDILITQVAKFDIATICQTVNQHRVVVGLVLWLQLDYLLFAVFGHSFDFARVVGEAEAFDAGLHVLAHDHLGYLLRIYAKDVVQTLLDLKKATLLIVLGLELTDSVFLIKIVSELLV